MKIHTSNPLPRSVLTRKAVVYVRQSSPAQVRDNLESQRRQYDLVDVARRHGFAEVEVIDDDLGLSASGSVARPGFERLVAWLCAGDIGAVLCFEASRVSRNGLDWHHILELCGLVEARVIDQDGIYDPRHPNDRLLLGMRGTISEFELGVLRARMLDAARAKAARGELRIGVPIGYVWDRQTGLGFDPDVRVQEAVRQIFARFRELGSGRQVMLALAEEQFCFPRPSDGKTMVSFDWTPIRYRNVMSVLKNPFCAGAYAYGKTRHRAEIVDGRVSYRDMRDHALTVSGATVRRAKRVDKRKDLWQVRVRPSSHEAVTVALAPTASCEDPGAVCTAEGLALSGTITTTIAGPPGLSVADAQVEEGPNATLAFAVTLDRAASGAVTVDYATADATATAGEDYTATSGTLTFSAGETAKTVTVAVLDDAHDEGSETLTLALSNASGAYLADGSATGTITNSDLMPQAWLARFGRTVADQVLDAVEGRITASRAAGMELSIAGQRVGAAAAPKSLEAREAEARLDAVSDWLRGEAAEDTARGLGSRAVTGQDFLTGTSFALTEGSAESGFGALWGRGAVSRFDGREGELNLDGEVQSAMLGADWALGRGAAGLVLSHASGEGGYPLATLAFYGPDDRRASKVVASIMEDGNDEAVRMRKWHSEEADVRHDAEIVAEVMAFIEEFGALSVAMPDRIIGCPHEEGIDYLGRDCPECPFWANRDRWTGEVVH